jgi:tRNA1Val (adenine37-N6)-methyltransferase
MPKTPTLIDPVLGPLTDDLLTRDLRVFQRLHGHRFSSDDMVTAFVAHRARPKAARVCDLGCGLGSVLLHLAWSIPEAALVGIEAQAMSFELLSRNVTRNDLAHRVTIHHGDLRDASIISSLGTFDLVTGTPPYFPPSTALDAEDEQRAYARIEYRGGVEAYLSTASQLLAPDGTLVLCGDFEAEARVLASASPLGLALTHRVDVIPREREPVLFSVWTLARTSAITPAIERLTLRDRNGEPTADAATLRAFSGFGAR